MANWQSIDELPDTASDLPRFTHALDELFRRLGFGYHSADCRSHFLALPSKRRRWNAGVGPEFEQCGELYVRKYDQWQTDLSV